MNQANDWTSFGYFYAVVLAFCFLAGVCIWIRLWFHLKPNKKQLQTKLAKWKKQLEIDMKYQMGNTFLLGKDYEAIGDIYYELWQLLDAVECYQKAEEFYRGSIGRHPILIDFYNKYAKHLRTLSCAYSSGSGSRVVALRKEAEACKLPELAEPALPSRSPGPLAH